VTRKKVLSAVAVILGASALIFVLVMITEVRTYGEQVATGCSDKKPVHTQLVKSTSPQLKKLAQYELLCKSAIVDQLMVFLPMPTSPSEANLFADNAARTLQEFSKNDITPLVLFEPSLTTPSIISDIYDGHYDNVLARYYDRLKVHSLTDSQMGTWVLFPEANTPTWRITDPVVFQANLIKVARLQKDAFPTSKVSILLNSRTHPDNDTSWSNGEIKSLVPYLNTIPEGLLDSFGYQGFPSQSPADNAPGYRLLKADQFLPTGIAQQAMTTLGIKKIWFNTGTYASIYTSDADKVVRQSTAQRHTILQQIIQQAQTMQGVDVSINIFAEDKTKTPESINWSYWQGNAPDKSPDAHALADFIATLQNEHIEFSLYDTL